MRLQNVKRMVRELSDVDKYREFFGEKLEKLTNGYRPDHKRQTEILSEIENMINVARGFERLIADINTEYHNLILRHKGNYDQDTEKARRDLIIKARIFYRHFIDMPLIRNLSKISDAQQQAQLARNYMDLADIEFRKVIATLNANRLRQAENEYTKRTIELNEEFKEIEKKLRTEVE